MKTTTPITYLYEVTGPDGASHEVAITRKFIGRTDCYSRGSMGTDYYTWSYSIDGGTEKPAATIKRNIAYEYARAGIFGVRYVNQPHLGPARGYVNVRSYAKVAAEMKANYRKQVKSCGST